MDVPAPALFSTIMGWPSVLAMRSARMRVSTSVAPPAGKGETTLMGRAGYVSACAPSAAALSNTVASSLILVRIMFFPLKSRA
ncbi:hypothetical protein D3C71_1809710 [compost metagenome]